MTDLQTWIEHPDRLDRDSLDVLRRLVEHYPYYQTARLLYLKNLYLLHDPAFTGELHRAIIYITHRASLCRFIEGDRSPLTKEKSGETVPDESSDRTLALINAFLSSVPEESSYAAIGNGIATDYAAYLLKEEEQTDEKPDTEVAPMRGQALIDQFIEQADEGFSFQRKDEEAGFSTDGAVDERPSVDIDEDADIDDSYFTETLAKIYIKQQRYAKALEIIKKLSLKYPKKNTYFADQIKYLENLIINAKSKKIK